MPAIDNQRDVDVQYVARLERAIARLAVTHDMIERDAGGIAVAAIIQRRRHRTMIEGKLAGKIVQP